MLDHFYIILAVGAFIADHNGKILVVKKSPLEKIDGGLWTIPGGKVDRNEPIIHALKREIKEEVGLTISDFTWIGEDVFESNGYTFHSQHFLCHVKKSPVKLEKNLLEYQWVTKKNLSSLKFPVNIKKRLVTLL